MDALGDGRDGRLGSAPATLAPHSTMAPARLDAKTGGMLLRFFAARMQGRKTMMCTMSGELAAFLGSAVLPTALDGWEAHLDRASGKSYLPTPDAARRRGTRRARARGGADAGTAAAAAAGKSPPPPPPPKAGPSGEPVKLHDSLVSGLLAIKHGTEVNVLSFAQECRVDESIASSVAFLLASATGAAAARRCSRC